MRKSLANFENISSAQTKQNDPYADYNQVDLAGQSDRQSLAFESQESNSIKKHTFAQDTTGIQKGTISTAYNRMSINRESEYSNRLSNKNL